VVRYHQINTTREGIMATPKSREELETELEQLRTQLAERTSNGLSFKVSEKGAVSVYGLNQRFPVTLYKSQWERLLSHQDELRAFIKANVSKLTVK
jgi:hypothetical protein